MNPRNVARGLAWFGIGLGLAEVIAPRAMARATGLNGRERLIRAFGVREIASGALILAAKDPEAWLWTRVAGDALDSVVLAQGMQSRSPERRHRALMATLAVLPVVVLDTLYAKHALGSETAEYLPRVARGAVPAASLRRSTNGVAQREPVSLDDVPS